MTVLAGPYPSEHFSLRELSCPLTGDYYHDPEFLWRLERMRELNGGVLFRVNSAHRSRVHNARVGGAAHSQHKKIAADISLVNHDPVRMYNAAKQAGFLGIGLAGSFIHVDLRLPIDGRTFPRDRLTIWFYSPQGEERWKNLVDF